MVISPNIDQLSVSEMATWGLEEQWRWIATAAKHLGLPSASGISVQDDLLGYKVILDRQNLPGRQFQSIRELFHRLRQYLKKHVDQFSPNVSEFTEPLLEQILTYSFLLILRSISRRIGTMISIQLEVGGYVVIPKRAVDLARSSIAQPSVSDNFTVTSSITNENERVITEYDSTDYGTGVGDEEEEDDLSLNLCLTPENTEDRLLVNGLQCHGNITPQSLVKCSPNFQTLMERQRCFDLMVRHSKSAVNIPVTFDSEMSDAEDRKVVLSKSVDLLCEVKWQHLMEAGNEASASFRPRSLSNRFFYRNGSRNDECTGSRVTFIPGELNSCTTPSLLLTSQSDGILGAYEEISVRQQLTDRLFTCIVNDLLARFTQQQTSNVSQSQEIRTDEVVVALLDQFLDQILGVALTHCMNEINSGDLSCSEQLSKLITTATINVSLEMHKLILRSLPVNAGMFKVTWATPSSLQGYTRIEGLAMQVCQKVADMLLDNNVCSSDLIENSATSLTTRLIQSAYPAACDAMRLLVLSQQHWPKNRKYACCYCNCDKRVAIVTEEMNPSVTSTSLPCTGGGCQSNVTGAGSLVKTLTSLEAKLCEISLKPVSHGLQCLELGDQQESEANDNGGEVETSVEHPVTLSASRLEVNIRLTGSEEKSVTNDEVGCLRVVSDTNVFSPQPLTFRGSSLIDQWCKSLSESSNPSSALSEECLAPSLQDIHQLVRTVTPERNTSRQLKIACVLPGQSNWTIVTMQQDVSPCHLPVTPDGGQVNFCQVCSSQLLHHMQLSGQALPGCYLIQGRMIKSLEPSDLSFDKCHLDKIPSRSPLAVKQVSRCGDSHPREFEQLPETPASVVEEPTPQLISVDHALNKGAGCGDDAGGTLVAMGTTCDVGFVSPQPNDLHGSNEFFSPSLNFHSCATSPGDEIHEWANCESRKSFVRAIQHLDECLSANDGSKSILEGSNRSESECQEENMGLGIDVETQLRSVTPYRISHIDSEVNRMKEAGEVSDQCPKKYLSQVKFIGYETDVAVTSLHEKVKTKNTCLHELENSDVSLNPTQFGTLQYHSNWAMPDTAGCTTKGQRCYKAVVDTFQPTPHNHAFLTNMSQTDVPRRQQRHHLYINPSPYAKTRDREKSFTSSNSLSPRIVQRQTWGHQAALRKASRLHTSERTKIVVTCLHHSGGLCNCQTTTCHQRSRSSNRWTPLEVLRRRPSLPPFPAPTAQLPFQVANAIPSPCVNQQNSLTSTSHGDLGGQMTCSSTWVFSVSTNQNGYSQVPGSMKMAVRMKQHVRRIQNARKLRSLSSGQVSLRCNPLSVWPTVTSTQRG